MTEQLDYVAKIRAKGCANTGITEDIARELHQRPGRRIMAVVELKVEERHEKAEGQHRVDLIIEQVEPAIEDNLDEHLRQLLRTKHQNRVLESQDQALDIELQEDLEPSVEDVIAAQRAHQAGQPHVFDPADNGDDCIVCGEDLEHDLHLTVPEPDVEPDEPEPALEEDLEPATT